jgi:hypothetical protein
LKKDISKAAIAQYFAEMIANNEVEIDPNDPSIKYLIEAIDFATTV